MILQNMKGNYTKIQFFGVSYMRKYNYVIMSTFELTIHQIFFFKENVMKYCLGN